VNLKQIFCPNLDCPARGQCDRGNISLHSDQEKRCYCNVCNKTFSVTKGSIFYRLKTDAPTVVLVLTLLAVDGLVSYISAFQRAFRSRVPRWGQPGRCHLRPWSEVAIVQVVKQRVNSHLSIIRRIVQGSTHQVADLLQLSQRGGKINTAFIERLNGTFRQRLAWLACRSRNLARQPETLQAGMFMVGCIYNFCTYHDSLRVAFCLAKGAQRWLQRTPAIAAGLTDHRWTMDELFNFKVPPLPWTPPKQRGRPSQLTLQLVEHWCH